MQINELLGCRARAGGLRSVGNLLPFFRLLLSEAMGVGSLAA